MTDYLWTHVDQGDYDKNAVQSVGGVVFKGISNTMGIITADKAANYEGTKFEKVGLASDIHEFCACKKIKLLFKKSMFASVNLSGNFMTCLARQQGNELVLHDELQLLVGATSVGGHVLATSL